MKRLLFLLCFLWPAAAAAQPNYAAHAVVRVPSHGASATVIQTERGRALLLGCAHAFEGANRTKPITLDVPSPDTGAPRQAAVRLLTVDYDLDLSLLELADGPLPYCCPVAPAGYRPRRLLSVGYDAMELPARQEPATEIGSGGGITFTRERPRPGRSGGALIDMDYGLLVGVVQGYEPAGAQRGRYVAHAAILEFLQRRDAPPRPRCPTCPRRGPCPELLERRR